MSQLSYCPLVWIFRDRTTNSQNNKVPERDQLIAYRDIGSSFDQLLVIDNSVSIHQRNLQLLLTEIYKTKIKLNPSIMKDIFIEKTSTYTLRDHNGFMVPRVNTTAIGIETIRYIQ